MELKVINTEKEYNERQIKHLKKENAKFNCYFKALEDHNTKNTVYWGVKLVKEFTESHSEYPVILMYLIEKMTYREFMQIFPIEKTYDGDKWECKDYFSTMDYLKDKNLDDVIGENAFDLIWEYHNKYVRKFGVKYMMYTEKEYVSQGGKSFIDMLGIPKKSQITMYDIDGKKFLMDSNGKTVPVKRNTGLKVIK